MDIGLIVYLALWYLGNYYYNIYNKLALQASGGIQFAFTLAWLQLAVGSVYALFLWAAPEARTPPKVRHDPIRPPQICSALTRRHDHVHRCPFPTS